MYEQLNGFWQDSVLPLGTPMQLAVLGTFVLHMLNYYIVGFLYILLDMTAKPSFIRRYKIQPGENEPLTSEVWLPLSLSPCSPPLPSI